MAKRIEIQRADDDIEIDRLFHFMVFAETSEARKSWEKRWREAINARNAARSAAEVEAIERSRGLRQ